MELASHWVSRIRGAHQHLAHRVVIVIFEWQSRNRLSRHIDCEQRVVFESPVPRFDGVQRLDYSQVVTIVRLVICVTGMVIGSWVPVTVSRICPFLAE
jgi:thiosulfate reductase cytochrome b subunit